MLALLEEKLPWYFLRLIVMVLVSFGSAKPMGLQHCQHCGFIADFITRAQLWTQFLNEGFREPRGPAKRSRRRRSKHVSFAGGTVLGGTVFRRCRRQNFNIKTRRKMQRASATIRRSLRIGALVAKEKHPSSFSGRAAAAVAASEE